MKMMFQEIRIIATGPWIANKLRDVNIICRSWKIYVFKIEIVPFIINANTELTTVVNFEVSVQKWCGRSCICGLFNFQLWRIYQLKKFWKSRIIDRWHVINIPVCEIKGFSLMNLLFFDKILKKQTPTHMSIKINRLEEGHNSYPLVCRRPAETVTLQRRQICYRWGTPAYYSLVPRSSMFYLFEFCLKNMWNCSLTQQILSHSFYDWMLCELFLLSGFLICHAVGWYIELKKQKVWWRIPERKILI